VYKRQAWRDLLDTYKQLGTAKWSEINRIEKHLPASPFGNEVSTTQKALTATEKVVPLLFLGVYALGAIAVLVF